MENSSESGGLSLVKGFNKCMRMYVVATRVVLVAAIATEIFIEPRLVLDIAEMYGIPYLSIKIAIVVESALIMVVVAYGCRVLLKYFHSLAALTEDSEDTRV